MKRSFPLAPCSIGSVRFSAQVGTGGRIPTTRLPVGHLPKGYLRFAKPRFSTQAACHPVRRADAFTLIELLVVIAVIAILAALTLSTLGYVNKRGAESRARAEVAALSTAIESFKLQFGSYPATNNLFNELTGQGLVNSNRVLFEPTPGMVDTNANPRRFIDPWGSAYNYSTNQSTIFNVGFFDLWTTNNSSDSSLWIRN